jgi:hypothetical protein
VEDNVNNDDSKGVAVGVQEQEDWWEATVSGTMRLVVAFVDGRGGDGCPTTIIPVGGQMQQLW